MSAPIARKMGNKMARTFGHSLSGKENFAVLFEADYLLLISPAGSDPPNN
jgi:hypothetical protein